MIPNEFGSGFIALLDLFEELRDLREYNKEKRRKEINQYG